MKSIGVLGGTYNPVHLGHLAVADEVMSCLGLDEVWLLPAGRPWMKEGEPVAAAEHRVCMLRLAIEGKPAFRLSTLEIERPGPTYTVDTMARLRDILEKGDELYFILSWGTLAQLPQWREPGRLVETCRLVAVPRPGLSSPDLGSLDEIIPGLSRRVILLDKPLINISATEIRRRVALGMDIGQLVPAAVARYIKERGLYRLEEGG
jgi:nicotinate-nucleotide adenylyltransferase